MGEVRKLQKKLRQIGSLEIQISLSPEERFKISRKAELRSRLAELQLQLSGPQQTLGIVADEKQEKMKRHVEDAPETLPSQTPLAPKILKAEKKTAPAKMSDHCREVPAERSGSDAEQRQEEAEFACLKSSWEKSKFRLRLLEGHNDIVTCVVAVDNLVVSGSRDTTVKVWHVPTAAEEHKNLGGHTGGVTCLSAPPPEYCKSLARALSLSDKERFILSGSADCNVKIWALCVGQCVKSLYTFNAVTALCFVPEGDGYIVTGSDAGKVQAWSWHTFQNCQSINAHQEAVTSIQAQGPLVFCGSADGGVSVWENRPRGDRVFLSYGRAWLKILHWRTGTTSRLTNHSSITGVTDCVHQTGGLLIGSCYDLANGESSLNLFSLPQCRYLASLTWPDSPRILCFAAWTTGSGDHRWVTGGRDLLVWEQLPSAGKQRGDVTAKRDSRLESCVMESEGDSEDDEDTDDFEDDDDNEGEERRCDGVEDGGSGSWLRCVLQ
ncbi:putative E3 ubiquitin ligase complex SCF subunit scon-2 [Dissostichus eleginoides]|uniref:E3 ubiquitin ligase complex SCF subunit scon-2 n=1 Tax=Dissostichus eleginoides TaxID=100907 RepID=A0AAD9F7T6_DISEL|nr:putative E3 ubiquitin ligase complex SCF subunit scon-2 [Dissostichus eleginoides]